MTFKLHPGGVSNIDAQQPVGLSMTFELHPGVLRVLQRIYSVAVNF